MDTLGFVIWVAVSAGVFAGVQAPLKALAASRVGLLEGALLPHIVGAITALVRLLFLGFKGLRELPSVPWYACLSGVLGVGLVWLSEQSSGALAGWVARSSCWIWRR